MSALNVFYAGHEKCPPGHAFGPAVRQHYLLHMILEGRGIYQTRDSSFPLRKGQAFLIYPEGRTDLYVNLRCMHIEDEQLTLYAGGGLLASSELNDEWQETEKKLQTMRRILVSAPIMMNH